MSIFLSGRGYIIMTSERSVSYRVHKGGAGYRVLDLVVTRDEGEFLTIFVTDTNLPTCTLTTPDPSFRLTSTRWHSDSITGPHSTTSDRLIPCTSVCNAYKDQTYRPFFRLVTSLVLSTSLLSQVRNIYTTHSISTDTSQSLTLPCSRSSITLSINILLGLVLPKSTLVFLPFDGSFYLVSSFYESCLFDTKIFVRISLQRKKSLTLEW